MMSGVKLSVRQSKTHGKGLFADQRIPQGTTIIQYTGQKIPKKEGRRRERFYESIGYCLLFNFDDKHDIDAIVGGNESIYINHKSRQPNLQAVVDETGIWFETLREIKRGEELFFNYGFTPEKPRKFA
jgi:SET domain-containing protein